MAYINWNLDPEAFSLGPITIRWYGLCFLLAFLCGFWIARWMFRREGKPAADVDSLLVHAVVGTIIGARLGHCIFYDPHYYFSDPILIFKIWEGGLASHGGLVGVLIALWIYAKKHSGQPFLWVVDRVAITTALAGFFIRLGNLFNSEIIGVPAEVPWAFVFHRIDTLPRHPAQLYESLAYLLIFLVLILLYRKRGTGAPHGFYLGVFFVSVFTARFLIEFVKVRQAAFGEGLPLSMGQLLSLPVIAAGMWLLLRRKPETQAS